MVFDIGFAILLIVFIGVGYRKGLVSMLLSLGTVALSVVLAMYVSYKWPLIHYPVFGYWIQVVILFIVFGVIIRKLIDMLQFENIAVVGFLSRLLGGILYGLIFAVVVFFLALALFMVAPQFLQTQFPDSKVLAWIRDFWNQINAAGGLQGIQERLQQGKAVACNLRYMLEDSAKK